MKLILAAALTLSLLPGLASAESLDHPEGVTLNIKLDDIRTADGRAASLRQLEMASKAFCRGHPSTTTTVVDCTETLTRALVDDLALKTGVRLADTRTTLADR